MNEPTQEEESGVWNGDRRACTDAEVVVIAAEEGLVGDGLPEELVPELGVAVLDQHTAETALGLAGVGRVGAQRRVPRVIVELDRVVEEVVGLLLHTWFHPSRPDQCQCHGVVAMIGPEGFDKDVPPFQ